MRKRPPLLFSFFYPFLLLFLSQCFCRRTTDYANFRCSCAEGWLHFDCGEYFLAASPANGVTDELGLRRASFGLALARGPREPVTCSLSVDDATEGVAPESVTLGAENWRAAMVSGPQCLGCDVAAGTVID